MGHKNIYVYLMLFLVLVSGSTQILATLATDQALLQSNHNNEFQLKLDRDAVFNKYSLKPKKNVLRQPVKVAERYEEKHKVAAITKPAAWPPVIDPSLVPTSFGSSRATKCIFGKDTPTYCHPLDGIDLPTYCANDVHLSTRCPDYVKPTLCVGRVVETRCLGEVIQPTRCPEDQKQAITACLGGVRVPTYCELIEEEVPTNCVREAQLATYCRFDNNEIVRTLCQVGIDDWYQTPTHCSVLGREKVVPTNCPEGEVVATRCYFEPGDETGFIQPTNCYYADPPILSTSCPDDELAPTRCRFEKLGEEFLATHCPHRTLPTHCPENKGIPTQCEQEVLPTVCKNESDRAHVISTTCSEGVLATHCSYEEDPGPVPTNCPNEVHPSLCLNDEFVPTICPDGVGVEDECR